MAEGADLLIRARLSDLGDALVDEAVLERILEEDVPILDVLRHALSRPPAAVMGTAW